MKVITDSNSWVDFENKLNSLSEKSKGNAFEELTRLYFLTDPVYVNQLDKVWHHSEVPQKIKDELKLPIKEIGIDLICKTKKETIGQSNVNFIKIQIKTLPLMN